MPDQWKVKPSDEIRRATDIYCRANGLKFDSRQIITIWAIGLEALTGQHIDQPLRKRGGYRRKRDNRSSSDSDRSE